MMISSQPVHRDDRLDTLILTLGLPIVNQVSQKAKVAVCFRHPLVTITITVTITIIVKITIIVTITITVTITIIVTITITVTITIIVTITITVTITISLVINTRCPVQQIGLSGMAGG